MILTDTQIEQLLRHPSKWQWRSTMDDIRALDEIPAPQSISRQRRRWWPWETRRTKLRRIEQLIETLHLEADWAVNGSAQWDPAESEAKTLMASRIRAALDGGAA